MKDFETLKQEMLNNPDVAQAYYEEGLRIKLKKTLADMAVGFGIRLTKVGWQLVDDDLDRASHTLMKILNQEVRKALDSIEVPKMLKPNPTEPAEIMVADAYKLAIDRYTANIKEVRAKYE